MWEPEWEPDSDGELTMMWEPEWEADSDVGT